MQPIDPHAMYYSLIRNFLFKFDPEKVHRFTLKFLNTIDSLKLSQYFPKPPAAPCRVMGLDFPNPVGLAAGMDKNGEYISALASLGFGFIEVGTVTPKAQAGNDPPRLFRLPDEQALINRMGFNNHGIDYLMQQAKASRYKGILGVNIGKNSATSIENAIEDYLLGFRRVAGIASYITVNISSPNTVQLRSLQFGESLINLLRALKQEQKIQADLSHKYTPIAVKISPDLTSEEIKAMAEIFLTEKIDAIIATNTTLSRCPLADDILTNR